jgi:predicted NUDIX family phosphoesterase
MPDRIGLINDDSNDVGLHHIGIIFKLEVPTGTEVTVRETDQLEGYWIRTKDLKKDTYLKLLNHGLRWLWIVSMNKQEIKRNKYRRTSV